MDALNQCLLEVPVLGVWVRNTENSESSFNNRWGRNNRCRNFLHGFAHLIFNLWADCLTFWKHVDYSNFPMLLASTVCYLTLVCGDKQPVRTLIHKWVIAFIYSRNILGLKKPAYGLHFYQKCVDMAIRTKCLKGFNIILGMLTGASRSKQRQRRP